MVVRDCNWFPDFETVPAASALVYSRILSELPAAREFASVNEYSCHVMADTDDVLAQARERALADYSASCP